MYRVLTLVPPFARQLILELFINSVLVGLIFSPVSVVKALLGVGPTGWLGILFIVMLTALTKKQWCSDLIVGLTPPDIIVTPTLCLPSVTNLVGIPPQGLAHLRSRVVQHVC